MKEFFNKISSYITRFAGSLTASILSIVLVISWLLGGLFFGFGDSYQIIANTATTLITFIICFIIQHSQNKDTKAIHIKLDALISAIENAENKYIDIENETEETLIQSLDELKKIKGS